MELMEISAHFMDYRACVRRAKAYPMIVTYQYLAARAYMQMLCAQAQYFAEVRP